MHAMVASGYHAKMPIHIIPTCGGLMCDTVSAMAWIGYNQACGVQCRVKPYL